MTNAVPLGMHFMVNNILMSLFWIMNLIFMFFLWTEWLDETIPSESIDDTDSIETDFSLDSILEGRKNVESYCFFFDRFIPILEKKKIFLNRMKKAETDTDLFLSAVRHLDYYYWKTIGTGGWTFIKSVVVGLASEGLKSPRALFQQYNLDTQGVV